MGRFVRFSLKRAAGVIVLSDGFKGRLTEWGIKVPIWTIPNWAPPEIVSAADRLTPAREPSKPLFTVLFAGNMGKAQGLETVLQAARILADEEVPVQFAMAGGGVEVEHLRALAVADAPLPVIFYPSRHPAQMGELFEIADALLVHLVDDPLFRITIPSKTQAYLAIGKPILMGVRGDAARMLEEAGAGLVFEPQSGAALARAVKEMMGLTPESRTSMGARGRAYYRQRLAFDIGVNAIERALTEAVAAHSEKGI